MTQCEDETRNTFRSGLHAMQAKNNLKTPPIVCYTNGFRLHNPALDKLKFTCSRVYFKLYPHKIAGCCPLLALDKYHLHLLIITFGVHKHTHALALIRSPCTTFRHHFYLDYWHGGGEGGVWWKRQTCPSAHLCLCICIHTAGIATTLVLHGVPGIDFFFPPPVNISEIMRKLEIWERRWETSGWSRDPPS